MTLTTTQRALDRNQSHEIPNHWPVGFAPPGGELLLGRLTRVVLAEAGRAAVKAGGLRIRPPPRPGFSAEQGLEAAGPSHPRNMRERDPTLQTGKQRLRGLYPLSEEFVTVHCHVFCCPGQAVAWNLGQPPFCPDVGPGPLNSRQKGEVHRHFRAQIRTVDCGSLTCFVANLRSVSVVRPAGECLQPGQQDPFS